MDDERLKFMAKGDLDDRFALAEYTNHGGLMERKDVQAKIEEIGIVPTARVKARSDALFAADTLYEAGIPILEIPLTLPEAPEVIEELTSRRPDFVVGAGTVLYEEEARRCIDAGARFLTSPGFIPEVVAHARNSEVVVLPGALTPTEIIAAWKAGAEFVKIFPVATAGGSHYVRALKVPFAEIPLVVTGGVNQLTAFEYILAGASAIGVGNELLPREALLHRQHYRIRELALRFLKMVKGARAQRDAP